MGIAASSAARAETTAGGPAYGSLEALGGPRKFKKKPVLVLDSDELEKAHAMFHEASAELLGEDIERTPRPAAILGLAPMVDDDPEEMGADDEVEQGAEDDLPAPEEVLALTRRNTPPPTADVFGEEDDDSLDSMSGIGGMSAGMINPSVGGSIDDDIDLENRIFPSLPVQPELAEEGETPSPAEAASEVPAVVSVETPAEQTGPEPEPEPEPEDVLKPEPEQSSPTPEIAKVEPTVPEPSVPEAVVPDWSEFREANPDLDFAQQSADAEYTPDPGIESEDDFDDDFDDLPPLRAGTDEPQDPSPAPQDAFDSWQAEPPSEPVGPDSAADLPFAPQPNPDTEAEPEAEPQAEAAPQPEPEPEPESEPESEAWAEPEAHSEAAPMPDLPPAPEADLPPAPSFEASSNQEAAPQPKAQDEADWDENEEHPEYTTIEDDHVDGYAFMRDQRSRRSAVMAAQEGRQSALRAKLMREAAEDAAQVEQAESTGSPLIRLWNWLRALFSRKG